MINKATLTVKSTISSWDKAERFSTAHQLELVDMDKRVHTDFVLVFDHADVALWDCRVKKPIILKVDFSAGASEHRRKHGGGAGQAIAKAVGLKGGRKLNVLDATAGLGSDAFVLASLGCHVSLFERSPIAHCLLEDAVMRAKNSDHDELRDIAARMDLMNEDSVQFLKAVRPNEAVIPPDVIYLDPMFPEKNKKALAKKEMQIFQALIGGDMDADNLLEPALAYATYRVVVKRPKQAPFLNNKEPSLQLVGKSSRFDIYTKKKLPD